MNLYQLRDGEIRPQGYFYQGKGSVVFSAIFSKIVFVLLNLLT